MLDQVMLVFEPSSFEPEEFFKGSGQGQDPVGVEPSELEVLSRIDRVESNHDYCHTGLSHLSSYFFNDSKVQTYHVGLIFPSRANVFCAKFD